jgi:O-antigen chain-terminating methyltransferase
MIETMIAKVDVVELMQRIRAEAKRREAAGITVSVAAGTDPLPLPPAQVVPARPTVHISDLQTSQTEEKLRGYFHRAAAKIRVSRWIPKPLRALFRKQGDFDKAILDALQVLIKSHLRTVSQIQNITAYLEAEGLWFRQVLEWDAIERSWLCAIPPVINDVHRKVASIEERVEDRIDATDSLRESVDELTAELRRVACEVHEVQAGLSEALQNLGELRENNMRRYEDATEKIAALRQQTHETREAHFSHASKISEERVAALQERIESLEIQQKVTGDALTDLRPRQQGAESKLDGIGQSGEEIRERAEYLLHIRRETEKEKMPREAIADELEALKVSLEAVRETTANVDERQVADGSFLKAQISLQARLLESLANTTDHHTKSRGASKPRGPESTEYEVKVDHANDAFYVAFENRFRGTRSEIKERMRVYIPFVTSRRHSEKTAAILDLGCGRGEWLELLHKLHYTKAEGVDSNSAMIEQCRERKLRVTERDAVSYLRQLKKASLSLVTAFHLIEHLPFSDLMKLIAETHRVIKKGGLVILETPNPRNILVGASDFYRDLTHRNPVHPDTLAFALESVGFLPPACYFLEDSAHRRTAVPCQNFQFDDLKDYITVPRDYAVIARKP